MGLRPKHYRIFHKTKRCVLLYVKSKNYGIQSSKLSSGHQFKLMHVVPNTVGPWHACPRDWDNFIENQSRIYCIVLSRIICLLMSGDKLNRDIINHERFYTLKNSSSIDIVHKSSGVTGQAYPPPTISLIVLATLSLGYVWHIDQCVSNGKLFIKTITLRIPLIQI